MKKPSVQNRKKHVIGIGIGVILFLAGICLFGLDLLNYSQFYSLNWSFETKSVTGQYRQLMPETVLKKGSYQFTFSGKNSGENNALIIYQDGAESQRIPFPLDSDSLSIPVNVGHAVEKISASAFYQDGTYKLSTLRVSAKRVLYRENVLRFLTRALLLFLGLAGLVWRFAFYESFCKAFPRLVSGKNEWILAFLILSAVLQSCLFLRSATIIGDDALYHMGRIQGIKESLQAGCFPARIYLFLAFDYGYASGLFYPDLFLYLPAVFCLLGFDVFTSYKIFLILINFSSALTMYCAGKSISGKKYGGLAASVLYSFCVYRMICLNYRAALGEELSMIFLPLIIWGLTEIFRGHPEKWYILSLGMIGIVFSHVLSIFIVGVLAGLFLLIRIRTIIFGKKVFVSLVKACLLTLAAAACFLFPLLEQLADNNVMMTSNGNPVQNGVLLKNIFAVYSFWVEGNKIPCLGYSLLCVPFLVWIFGRRTVSFRLEIYLTTFGLIALFFSSSLFPWNAIENIHQLVQFPYRFMGPASALFSICGGILAADLWSNSPGRWKKLIFITAFCILNVLPVFVFTVRNVYLAPVGTVLDGQRIGNGEYLPKSQFVLALMKEKPYPLGGSYWSRFMDFMSKNGNRVLSSDPSLVVTDFDRRGLRFTFEFQTSQKNLTFEIPFLYYKGYAAAVSANDGKNISLKVFKGEHGLTAVTADHFSSGKISLWYRGTIVQKISDGISLVTAVMSLIFLIGWIKKRTALVGSSKTD